jgi:hypothetical protein
MGWRKWRWLHFLRCIFFWGGCKLLNTVIVESHQSRAHSTAHSMERTAWSAQHGAHSMERTATQRYHGDKRPASLPSLLSPLFPTHPPTHPP